MIFWLDFIRLEFMYIVIFFIYSLNKIMNTFYLFIIVFFHLCISRLLRVFWGILWEFILIGYIDRKRLYFKGKVILFSK